MAWFKSLCEALAGVERPIREPVDHGSGLFRLPDPDPDAGQKYDARTESWITYEDAAKATLALYAEGRWGAEGGACPRCYEVTVDGNAAYLAEAHPDRTARKRWAAVHHEHQAMIAAYGECLCGKNLQHADAVQEAQEFNAPYLHRMG